METKLSVVESTELARTLAPTVSVPAPLRGRPGDVLATILTGAELGLAPMQSLRALQVIDGKVSLSAEAQVALVRRSDVCAEFRLVESTALRAVYSAKRKGDAEATTLAWTMEQAQRAGLGGSKAWQRYPEAMLRARCASALCKAVFSDVLLGIYDPDELADVAPRTLERIDPTGLERTLIAPRPAEPTPVPPPEHARTVVVARPSPHIPDPDPNNGDEGMPIPTAAELRSLDRRPAEVRLPPREPGDDDGDDEVMREWKAIARRCAEVQTGDELLALVPRIKSLPPEEQKRMRGHYSQARMRLKKLEREAQR